MDMEDAPTKAASLRGSTAQLDAETYGTGAADSAVDSAAAALEDATASVENATAVAKAVAAEAAAAEAAEAAAAEEEILPLEQWKEQAHAILQAHSMQREVAPLLPVAALGAAPGAATIDGAGNGPAPAPAPLPFVRPATPLKDRFNYLTSEVGAKVVATSEGMKGASHILNGDRDQYMMAERELKKKWVTLACALVTCRNLTRTCAHLSHLRPILCHRRCAGSSKTSFSTPSCSPTSSTIHARHARCRSSVRSLIHASSGRCWANLTRTIHALSKSSSCASPCGRAI